jgi:5-methylcytosine-specific restriction enzyme subunit McrC
MIPIQNLYFMLCYAWDVLPEKGLAYVGHEDNLDILNLFAMVMTRGFLLLRKRGLYRGYVEISNETRQIRGKIDFQASLQKLLHEQGKMQCSFDELTNNVLANQILKATFRLLYRYKDLDSNTREELSECLKMLQFVDSISLSPSLYSKVLLPGSQRVYKFLLRISQFIVENQLINEDGGTAQFAFFEDEKKMHDLFEKFLRNFYRWELRENGCKVKIRKSQVRWLFNESSAHVPIMETDLLFQYKGKHFIMDAKYYQKMLVSREKFSTKETGNQSSHQKIRSDHLYQIFSYIKNWEHYQKKMDNTEPSIHGMLIYPVAEGNHAFHETYSFDHHQLTVASINLYQDTKGIKRDLLSLVEEKPDLLA